MSSNVKYKLGAEHTASRASDRLQPYQHHKVERSLVCVEGRGRICRSGLMPLAHYYDVDREQSTKYTSSHCLLKNREAAEWYTSTR